ncbi:MAG: 4Fe-4S binding protein [Candidatus Eisenbacteria bacterium]
MSSNDPRESDISIKCIWTCGLCSAVCRDMAISYRPDSVEVDKSVCSGCLVCVKVCPAGMLGEETFA